MSAFQTRAIGLPLIPVLPALHGFTDGTAALMSSNMEAAA